MSLIPRKINLKNERETAEVRAFLESFDLSYNPSEVEYTLALLDENENFVATGSIKGEVIRNLAVKQTGQGEGYFSTLLSILMQELNQRKCYHYFIFTKPSVAKIFESLAFKEIERVDPVVVLLENGMGSISSFCTKIAKKLPEKKGTRAALVMNCNPFTLGHRSLIERAAKECDDVVVFVVKEDASTFPFEHRIEMVRAGVADLENVTVLDSGNYMISAATFPTYFTHGDEAVEAQTKLDIKIFARYIAKACDIDVRYVGEEPYCEVTSAYNRAMEEILPEFGVELRVIERTKKSEDIISASKVREAIKNDDWDRVLELVPKTTYDALRSDELACVIENIKGSNTRH